MQQSNLDNKLLNAAIQTEKIKKGEKKKKTTSETVLFVLFFNLFK